VYNFSARASSSFKTSSAAAPGQQPFANSGLLIAIDLSAVAKHPTLACL